MNRSQTLCHLPCRRILRSFHIVVVMKKPLVWINPSRNCILELFQHFFPSGILRIWDSVTASHSLIHDVCEPLNIALKLHEHQSFTGIHALLSGVSLMGWESLISQGFCHTCCTFWRIWLMAASSQQWISNTIKCICKILYMQRHFELLSHKLSEPDKQLVQYHVIFFVVF